MPGRIGQRPERVAHIFALRCVCQYPRNAFRSSVDGRGAPLGPSHAKEHGLAVDLDRFHIDFVDQLGQPRAFASEGTIRLTLRQEGRVRSELLARRPCSRPSDHQSGGVRHNDGFEVGLAVRVGELMVESHESVIAAFSPSFQIPVHGLNRRVPRGCGPSCRATRSRSLARTLVGPQRNGIGACRSPMSPESDIVDIVHSRRRSALFDAMSAASPSSVAVISAAPVFLRNNDVEHDYRQDSDFYYLTGLDEPDSVLVLDARERTMTLFVRPRDPAREVWVGARAGVEGAKTRFRADQAFPIAEFDERLVDVLGDRRRLYYRLGADRSFDDGS